MPPDALPERLAAAIRAFQQSRVLLSGLELDVFTQIGNGATAAELASRIHTDPRATEMLLNALVALEALEKSGDRFLPTPATRLLAGERRAGWLHTANMWNTWSQLTTCVRAGSPPAFTEIEARPEDWREAFIAAMESGAAERAPQLAEAAGPAPIARLLDVGGGSAAYSIAFARRHPGLVATVFDLPEVLPITRRYIQASGLGDRIGTVAGDLRTDTFVTGFDFILLSSICHMLNKEGNLDLFRRCRAALVPGGRLMIQEFILEEDKTQPLSAVLFSLNMLVGTRDGAAYSAGEYTAWLQSTGFTAVSRRALPGPTSLLIAATN